jgi:hypothetical protein
MNTSFVKSVPQGDFADVSALRSDWRTQFHALVSKHQPIKFDFYPLPNIPQEIQSQLQQAGYRDLILENDQWQHFLVPIPNPAADGMIQTVALRQGC